MRIRVYWKRYENWNNAIDQKEEISQLLSCMKVEAQKEMEEKEKEMNKEEENPFTTDLHEQVCIFFEIGQSSCSYHFTTILCLLFDS